MTDKTKASHTPGPWKYVKSHAVIDSDDWEICDFSSCSTEEGHANARLIAAAPDLLEACKDCRMHIETIERIHDHELPEGEMLCAAIAKATNE